MDIYSLNWDWQIQLIGMQPGMTHICCRASNDLLAFSKVISLLKAALSSFVVPLVSVAVPEPKAECTRTEADKHTPPLMT